MSGFVFKKVCQENKLLRFVYGGLGDNCFASVENRILYPKAS